ncbi:hypothetical protein [Orenia marismortui]|uniref:hypothetical protein n=1 Tax=Orenia marismortui TaxID=46469 RepID=UPI00036CBDC8|nr:hypothetical protein [Orenia marismortui]
MKLSLVKFIFNGFPEVLLLLYVSVGLLGLRMSVEEYIKVGMINLFILAFIREYLDLFGLHTFIGLIIIIFSINYLLEVDIMKIIISMFISFILLFIGETFTFSLMVNSLGVDIEEINNNLKLYFMVVYGAKIPLLITALAIYKFDLKIFNEKASKLRD